MTSHHAASIYGNVGCKTFSTSVDPHTERCGGKRKEKSSKHLPLLGVTFLSKS